jgi:hypothetical protein
MNTATAAPGKWPWAIQCRKECGALWLGWLIALVAPPLLFMRGATRWGDAAWLVHVAGCAWLGTHALGYEFGCGTLGHLLAQPVSRQKLWWQRMAVLGILLATVGATFSLLASSLARPPQIDSGLGLWTRLSGTLLPAVCAFCTGPMMALYARSTLGALVFTLFVPGALLVFTQELVHRSSGVDLPAGLGLELDRQTELLYGALMGIYCLCALGLGYRKWMRLETADTLGAHVSPLDWISRLKGGRSTESKGPTVGAERLLVVQPSGCPEGARSLDVSGDRLKPALQTRAGATGRPWLALIKKELHLQQWAMLAAAMFLLLLLVAAFRGRAEREELRVVLQPLSVICCGFVCLLAGALAGAEDRQHGTHAWHLVLPVPACLQWLVKSGVAWLVAMACSLVIVVLVTAAAVVHSGSGWWPWALGMRWEDEGFAALWAVFWVTSLAMATSASSTSAARGFLGAVLMMVLLGFMMSGVIWVAQDYSRMARIGFPTLAERSGLQAIGQILELRYLAMLMAAVWSVLTNWVVAFLNFREDRPGFGQVAFYNLLLLLGNMLAGCCWCGVVILGGH